LACSFLLAFFDHAGIEDDAHFVPDHPILLFLATISPMARIVINGRIGAEPALACLQPVSVVVR
jgi:hypothetical protein